MINNKISANDEFWLESEINPNIFHLATINFSRLKKPESILKVTSVKLKQCYLMLQMAVKCPFPIMNIKSSSVWCDIHPTVTRSLWPMSSESAWCVMDDKTLPIRMSQVVDLLLVVLRKIILYDLLSRSYVELLSPIRICFGEVYEYEVFSNSNILPCEWLGK